MKVWLAGTGKSLAVGVGTRGDGGEIDLDLLEEGILAGANANVWGVHGYAGMTEAMQGLRGCLMKESLRTWMCLGCSARAFGQRGEDERVGRVWANKRWSRKKREMGVVRLMYILMLLKEK